MKNNQLGHCWAIVCVVALLATVRPAGAQNTAFTYNGRLTGNGALVTGLYDMQFTLYDDITGNIIPGAGPLPINSVGVTNGLFTVRIDFGAGKFTGPPRWLDVAVRPSGGVSFTSLSPRQEVTSSPYSIRSQSAGSADSGGSGSDSVWSVTANNAHYDVGSVGIGTATPQSKLAVQTGTGSYGFTHTDGAITVGSYVGSSSSGAVGGWLGTRSANPLHFFISNGQPSMTLDTTGKVGVGTFTPQTKLHVVGDAMRFEKDGKILDLTAGTLTDITARNTSLVIQSLGTGGNNHLILNPFPNSGAFPNGNVGIGTFNPQSKLHVESFGALESTVKSLTDRASLTLDSTIGGQQRVYTLDNGLSGTPGLFGIWDRTAAQARLVITPAGNVGIGTATPQTKLDVQGTTRTCVLTITGGCDLAEPFPLKEGKIPKGSVVVIDDEHAGRLMRSERAYDSRVAGIVSGANGINPGITLQQDGAFTDGENVALSGRVYVQADANFGAIKPGDLLTTSATPGHAMKVGDHARAQGAILGKAMGTLKEGKGMVLVLVTLQ